MRTDGRVRQLLAVLQQQPHLHVALLAPLVHLSRSRVQHLFKEHIGMSIDAYTIELRLQRARVLLATTFLPVKIIRNECGMPDAANFTRQFKKRFGMTPSAYRDHSRRDQDLAEYANK